MFWCLSRRTPCQSRDTEPTADTSQLRVWNRIPSHHHIWTLLCMKCSSYTSRSRSVSDSKVPLHDRSRIFARTDQEYSRRSNCRMPSIKADLASRQRHGGDDKCFAFACGKNLWWLVCVFHGCDDDPSRGCRRGGLPLPFPPSLFLPSPKLVRSLERRGRENSPSSLLPLPLPPTTII